MGSSCEARSGLFCSAFSVPGHAVTIVSDKNWQCSVYQAYQNTEAPFPNYRLSESNIRFDARKDGRLESTFFWDGQAIEIGFPNHSAVGRAR